MRKIWHAHDKVVGRDAPEVDEPIAGIKQAIERPVSSFSDEKLKNQMEACECPETVNVSSR